MHKQLISSSVIAFAVAAGADYASAGTITVNDTNAGTRSDSKCRMEEAVLALEMRTSYRGCTWSGTIGSNDTIIVGTNGTSDTFNVGVSLSITRPVTIRSSRTNVLANIRQTVAGNNLFGISHQSGPSATFTFQDIHMIGPGKTAAGSTGLSVSGFGELGETMNVTRCWIEQFSRGGIALNLMNLNITDTTIDSNYNLGGDGGGGVFYETSGSASTQVNSLTIRNSTISRNRSDKGGGLQIQSNSFSQIINSTISANLSVGGYGGGVSFGNNDGTLQNGALDVIGSTIAFNGTTTSEAEQAGGGIANSVATNANFVSLVGSIVATNCLAELLPDGSFRCLTDDEFAGEIVWLEDTLLGSYGSTTFVHNYFGVVLVGEDADLDPNLTDQGGVGGRHPRVHVLRPNSRAIDAAAFLETPNSQDQRHQNRGFDRAPSGPNDFDFGAYERRN